MNRASIATIVRAVYLSSAAGIFLSPIALANPASRLHGRRLLFKNFQWLIVEIGLSIIGACTTTLKPLLISMGFAKGMSVEGGALHRRRSSEIHSLSNLQGATIPSVSADNGKFVISSMEDRISEAPVVSYESDTTQGYAFNQSERISSQDYWDDLSRVEEVETKSGWTEKVERALRKK